LLNATRLRVVVIFLLFIAGQAICAFHAAHDHGEQGEEGHCAICTFMAGAALVEASAPLVSAPIRTSELAITLPDPAVAVFRVFSRSARSPPSPTTA